MMHVDNSIFQSSPVCSNFFFFFVIGFLFDCSSADQLCDEERHRYTSIAAEVLVGPLNEPMARSSVSANIMLVYSNHKKTKIFLPTTDKGCWCG